jgi:hypothetical protein
MVGKCLVDSQMPRWVKKKKKKKKKKTWNYNQMTAREHAVRYYYFIKRHTAGCSLWSILGEEGH